MSNASVELTSHQFYEFFYPALINLQGFFCEYLLDNDEFTVLSPQSCAQRLMHALKQAALMDCDGNMNRETAKLIIDSACMEDVFIGLDLIDQKKVRGRQINDGIGPKQFALLRLLLAEKLEYSAYRLNPLIDNVLAFNNLGKHLPKDD